MFLFFLNLTFNKDLKCVVNCKCISLILNPVRMLYLTWGKISL